MTEENEYQNFIAPAGESEMACDARVDYAKAYRGRGIAQMGANLTRNVLLRGLFPEMREFMLRELGIDPKAENATIEVALSAGTAWLVGFIEPKVSDAKSEFEAERKADKEEGRKDD